MLGPIAQSPIAALVPLDPTTRVLSGVLQAPPADMTGAAFALEYILTPRPPVSLKESRRASANGGGWTTLLHVAEYSIPETRATPARIVSARYILSRVIATTTDGTPATLSVRVVDLIGLQTRTIFPSLTVPAVGYLDLPLKSAVVGPQEVLQVRALTGTEIHVSASYVAATREDFRVIP
jgi:hypothetical protein